MTAQMPSSTLLSRLNRLYFLKSDWKKGIIAFFITYIVVGLFNDHVQLLRNTSDSLPYNIFLYFPKMTPQRGDITVYKFNDQHIIKKISGIAGDYITYDKDGFLFVFSDRIGRVMQEDSKGIKLDPIPEGTIPEGYVFLSGTHKRSYDSRYKNIGLIHESDLMGKAIPLF